LHRSIVLATNHLQPLVQIAQAAEASGFYRVWTTEGSGGDAIARAQHIAANTKSILVATGIAYAFTRAPLAISVLAADVQETAGGRFALGLGSGTRGVRERRYGSIFDHPAPRLAEYVELVRTVLRSHGGLSFHGQFYNVDFPQFELPHDRKQLDKIELYGAALAPIMTRYMAGSCDGVALHSLAVFEPYFEEVTLPAIKRGAESAGRPPRVAAWNREWDEVARVIPDDMVDELTVAGTAKQVGEKLEKLERRLGPLGVDELVLQVVGGETAQETLSNCLAVVAAGGPRRSTAAERVT
jgi:alkanesulfonate monooxygenase SsuD/methylene tetrahydromethanopterin reductase-like flavin-dependent oxidoreductase (luciferase family)